jgi:hypothetical protein
MDKTEALKHIRTLINAASDSDDINLIYKLLREMRGIVNKALPAKTLGQRQRAAKKKKPALRIVR